MIFWFNQCQPDNPNLQSLLTPLSRSSLISSRFIGGIVSLKSWKFVILLLRRYLKEERAFYWDSEEERSRKNKKIVSFLPKKKLVVRDNITTICAWRYISRTVLFLHPWLKIDKFFYRKKILKDSSWFFFFFFLKNSCSIKYSVIIGETNFIPYLYSLPVIQAQFCSTLRHNASPQRMS